MTQEEFKRLYTYNKDTGAIYKLSNGKEMGTVVTDTRYIRLTIDKKPYLAHRLAYLYMTGEMPKHQIDHLNHIRNDNRWCNLKHVTQCENQQRKLKYSNGVTNKNIYDNHGMFKVEITNGGRKLYIGTYKTEEEAILARDKFYLQDS